MGTLLDLRFQVVVGCFDLGTVRAQPGEHVIESARELPDLVAAAHVDALVEVAGGDAAGCFDQSVHGRDRAPRGQHHQRRAQRDRQDRGQRRGEHGFAQLPAERIQAHCDAHVAQHLVGRVAAMRARRGFGIAHRSEDIEIGRVGGRIAPRRIHHISAQRAQRRPVKALRLQVRAALGEDVPVGVQHRSVADLPDRDAALENPCQVRAGTIAESRAAAERDGGGELQAEVQQDVLALAGLLVDDKTGHAAGGQQDEQDAEQVELGDEALALCHRLSVARRSRLAGGTPCVRQIPAAASLLLGVCQWLSANGAEN